MIRRHYVILSYEIFYELLLTLVLTGCQVSYNLVNNCLESYERPDWTQLQKVNAQHRQLWESNKIESYRYIYQAQTWFETAPIAVRVEQGEVFLSPDTQQAPQERQRYRVENLFERIDQTTKTPKACETLSVQYDPSYGFPTQNSWALMEKNLADALGGYQITDFTVSP